MPDATPPPIPPAVWARWRADPRPLHYRAGDILEGLHDADLEIDKFPGTDEGEAANEVRRIAAAIVVLQAALPDGHPMKRVGAA